MTSLPKRRCNLCSKAKPVTQFVKDSSRADGILPYCKPCHAAREVGYREQKAEAPLNGKTCPVDDTPIRGAAVRVYCSEPCRNKVSRLKRLYNLSIEDYRKIIDTTAGKCPVCLKRPSQFHIDHSHRKNDNRVFGAICAPCNSGIIAWSYHDPEYVRRALEYLENPPAERAGVFAIANPENHGPQRMHTVWKHKTKPKG